MVYPLCVRWEKVGKFIGTYNRTLDEKGRLQLPPRLVGEEKGPFYLMRGYEGCLSVYPAAAFDALVEKFEAYDFLDPKARKLLRLSFGSAEKLEVDGHGRLAIRKELLEKLGLEKEALLLGALDHFEIWKKETYEAYVNEGEDFEELASSLAKGE